MKKINLWFIVYTMVCSAYYATPALAEWKALVIAGSKSEHVFDNARMTISQKLKDKGVDVRTLSSDDMFVEFDPTVELATPMKIIAGFNKMGRRITDQCFIYITSHGVKDKGVMMAGRVATPRILNNYIHQACRGMETVIVISACFSGQFIEGLARTNRTILTASNAKRPSFGCSNDEIYTFYDTCFINNFRGMGDWKSLHKRIDKCVKKKETELEYERSFPQFFDGSQEE